MTPQQENNPYAACACGNPGCTGNWSGNCKYGSRAPAPTEPAVDRDAVITQFLRCTYPVAVEINPRGYNWCEAWLDEARAAALATPASPAVPANPRLILDTECVQGECACKTSGCWDECNMRRWPSMYGDSTAQQPMTLGVNIVYAAVPEPAPLAPSEQQRVMDALIDARAMAMRNSVEARVPECGDFAAIAQNLDWAVATMRAAPQVAQASQPTSAGEFPGVNIDRVHHIMDGYTPKPPPPRPQRPPGPLWTDAERERFRENMKRGERCPICSVIEGGQHFPGCSRGTP